ncbi:MAG TPA: ATP-binding protein [Candidatus Angelobacter sp.]|nr:ATP-binding protein [Candidatus Angelobacter sp.]
MATNTTTSWTESNHAHLVAEFARLKDQAGMNAADTRTGSAFPDVPEAGEALPAIAQLVELFGLSPFERDLLLLCAGVEMDSELATRCAEAHNAGQKPYVTFGLAMAMLPDPHWSAFTPSRPLRRYRLVELAGNAGLTASPVRIDERILHYLVGINLLEPSLETLLSAVALPRLVADEHLTTAHAAAKILANYGEYRPAIHLCGDDAMGQEDIAALAARHSGRHTFCLRAEDLPTSTADLERIIMLMKRESLLLPAAFVVQCGSSGYTTPARHLVEKLNAPLFLGTHEPVRLQRSFVRFDVNKPAPRTQRNLWQKSMGDSAEHNAGTVEDLSQHFRLSARMIFNTAQFAMSKEEDPRALWDACRSLARPKLEDLAQRIIAHAGWDDLVLPELQMRTLHQLAAQVWQRMKVYETWGFSAKSQRGLGISALFCGDSGTGKTLAAEVLAHELGLDLYRIDLASVVSKYIGETEKNLKQIFDAADEGGALLLFDEADALFGKRGEVKDSHDRYANIEIGYLLQRMETYQGLAILTTNLKSSLDRAFQRRLRFTVTFPFPDAPQREAIWGKVFPAATPTSGLNIKKLSQLNMAGGNIRNIALNAAFLAANAGSSVEMGHLITAARMEAHKIERPLSDVEVRGWV